MELFEWLSQPMPHEGEMWVSGFAVGFMLSGALWSTLITHLIREKKKEL